MMEKKARKPLTEELVNTWHAALLDRPEDLNYVRGRKISDEVIAKCQLGWDGDRISIPIRDSKGELVGCRRYKRDANPKMLNLSGWGSPTRLAFLDPDREEDALVLIAGGEWDALAAISAGFAACCGTNGEGSIPIESDLDQLRGDAVVVLMDADGPGRAAEKKWNAAVGDRAQMTWVVNVGARAGVKDVNDWFTSGGTADELLSLIEAYKPKPGDREAASDPVEQPAKSEPPGSRRPTAELIELAMRKVALDESRNSTGFWLAGQMRDERYTAEEAWTLALQPYQQAVTGLKANAPYPESEARESIKSAFSQPPRDPSGRSRFRFPLTEMGNAERLIAKHGDDFRFLPALDAFLVWSGKHWIADDQQWMRKWMKEVIRAIHLEAEGLDEKGQGAVFAWAKQSETAAKVESALKLVRSEPGVMMQPKQFDSDPMLLNLRNGSLDLNTGEHRPHRREDYCRRIIDVPYDPLAEAPRFQAFLERIQPDADTRAFLQKASGYSLTGRTDEQRLLLNLGTGSNGKSTFMELLTDLAGEYATFLPAEALSARSADKIPNDIARLDGARMVSVMEFEDSAQVNERMIKQLTGGDTISARYLHREWFDFRPQCTIWVSSNHHPLIRGTNDGIWRRFLLVPFNERITGDEVDRNLRAKLRATEMPGLLRWAVEGAIAWMKEGLEPPEAILRATQAYRADSDVLAGFLDEECEVDSVANVLKGMLYDRYAAWTRRNGLKTATAISFGRMLKERAGLNVSERRVGKEKHHTWFGIGLRSQAYASGHVIIGGSERDREKEPPTAKPDVASTQVPDSTKGTRAAAAKSEPSNRSRAAKRAAPKAP